MAGFRLFGAGGRSGKGWYARKNTTLLATGGRLRAGFRSGDDDRTGDSGGTRSREGARDLQVEFGRSLSEPGRVARAEGKDHRGNPAIVRFSREARVLAVNARRCARDDVANRQGIVPAVLVRKHAVR